MRSRKEKTKEQMKRKGQEEMVGFALIIVIVAIIILFFLSFALKSSGKDASESFEIDSFLHSSLQYTTICEERGKNATIRALISSCIGEEECSNGEDSCKILEENLGDMLEESWVVDENSPIKGYEFAILTNPEDEEDSKVVLALNKGNTTSNYKGALVDASDSRRGAVTVTLKVYN